MTTVRASVAIPRPVRRLFTYAVPPALLDRCRRGVRVIVPFGRNRLTGYVLALEEGGVRSGPPIPLKQIEEVLDPEPVLDDAILDLTSWGADYYVTSWGEMIRAALPGMRARLSREVVLTVAGRAALAAGAGDPGGGPARGADCSPADVEILRLVEKYARGEERGMRLPNLRRRIGAAFRPAAIAALRRRGLLREIDVAIAPGPGRRECEIVHLTAAGESSPPQRGERQQAVLRALGKAPGGMEMSLLLAAASAKRPTLRTLLDRGLVRIESREMPRRPQELSGEAPAPAPLRLSPAQKQAVDEIRDLLGASRFTPCLLHGVTGSGKTEVYIRAIESTLALGRRALYLVPEIGLTPLLAKRLRSRFGEALALLHSGLTDGERFDEWRRIRAGQVTVVLGARSAVFAPLPDLGLVVIDEEHDASYKQDEYPRYSGRDLAIMRGKMSDAVVVLGSATPSMESYHNARRGRYRLLSLPHRVGGARMPDVVRVDMRREFAEVGRETIISRQLASAIDEQLQRGEQTLVLLNRRGFSTFVLCRACGERVECRSCSIAMTLHLRQRALRCHYCDARRKVPERCPSCRSEHIHFGGTGTERLEDRLRDRFPAARIVRMDSDAVRGRGAAERILSSVERGEVDILLGTQMISKGHDFPNVTLVGVLGADALLGMPDFRAGERTFQILSQVAGRSGRRERGGRVIVQAYYVDHHAIRTACRHDFDAFARAELEYRRVMNYPPFSAMALVLLRDRRLEKASAAAARVAAALRRRGSAALQVLGPTPAPLERLRGLYRVQVILKGRGRRDVQAALAALHEELEKQGPGCQQMTIDVDPLSTL
jgi:primosomal protein N' (replication factor Y)